MPNTQTLAKPELVNGVLKYTEAMHFLEQKYGFESSDFSQSHAHYGLWCRKHKRPVNPKSVQIQQQIYSEYCAAPDGDVVRPEYENFWHWLLTYAELATGKRTLPAALALNVPRILTKYDELVAPLLQKHADAAAERALQAIAMLPQELQERARRQYAPKRQTLPQYVRTILAHFETEFGPKFQLDMR